ncbi:MAG: hypothetical protein AB3X44_05075 [Leptothrix sp. (in: b-proteobacteria)]
MNYLVNTLKQIAATSPLDSFKWTIPGSCPVAIPEANQSGYAKNVHLKENFHSIIGLDQTLESHYWVIQKWGGIGSFKKNEKNDHRIRSFMEELGREKLTRRSFECISSLSKVASFIDHNTYVIYDSRAIYSLNWLLFNYSSKQNLFPQPVGRSSDLAKYDMQTIFRLTKRHFKFWPYKDAFHEYCKLIKHLSPKIFGADSKPYKLEMLLFMIAPTLIIQDIENTVTLEIKKMHNLAVHTDAAR